MDSSREIRRTCTRRASRYTRLLRSCPHNHTGPTNGVGTQATHRGFVHIVLTTQIILEEVLKIFALRAALRAASGISWPLLDSTINM
jgi:hypothetical protein